MTQHEHNAQSAVIKWANMAETTMPGLRLIFAIPNGTFFNSRSPLAAAKYAAKLKAEGVKPGVPDLCLPVARGEYHGLYLEMKRPATPRAKRGVLSEPQKQWLQDLEAQGYRAIVAEGSEEAIKALTEYMQS